ncbi:MAG: hypothetical protein EPO58_00665 [Chitinophagaceae bacterium]|nr:hypothetical protein [Bacteroidota bacterium]TAJ67924.1 MAG: hypothetical protein EPO58_00665 [Chitinophagaceae bacterium]
MKKQFCTVFLLMVMTIQILPIQQLGGLLFNNQFTEEVPHAVPVEKGNFQKAFLRSDYISTTFESISSHINANSPHHYFDDAIPPNHTSDILVPPPNC